MYDFEKDKARRKKPPVNGKPGETETVIEQWQRLGRPIWERLPNESERTYARFVKYRDMGPERTLLRLAASERPEAPPRNIPGSIAGLAKRYFWVLRVRAYDERLNNIKTEAVINELEKHADIWEGRAITVRDQEYELGNRMLERALEALNNPTLKVSAYDVVRLASIGSKILRLASGLETTHEKVSSDMVATEFEYKSDSELERIIREAQSGFDED